jgi:hypothetical protein
VGVGNGPLVGRRKGQGVWLWIRGRIIIRGSPVCRWILRGLHTGCYGCELWCVVVPINPSVE